MDKHRDRLLIVTLAAIRWLIYAYLCVRFLLFFQVSMGWGFRCVAILFFLCEIFIVLHALGYFSYLKTVSQQESKPIETDVPQLVSYPLVAIVVASYKEPLYVLEDTLICFHNLTYPNKQLYFLDDTRYDRPWDTPEKVEEYKRSVEALCESIGINLFRRKWHHAKAGMINDFLEYVSGVRHEDFTMIPYSQKQQIEKEKYICVFDADMNPFPNFVEPLVAIMESQTDVAFVQTPQYYTNFANSLVARAASVMQAVFYEWICEAKGIKNLMIFCGTNVILRIDALKDVGGIDLSSVTEDFATAFRLHKKKWKSIYINKVCAFGMGPEDLGAFFKQQHRWALGTVGMLPKLIKGLLTEPFKYPPSFWWEYFLSSSYYLVGWVYFILMLGPVLYLFCDVPVYIFPPVLYIMLVVPYNICANAVFYLTLCRRGYLSQDLFAAVILGMLTVPVYMGASLRALLGLKGTFVVTPKGYSSSLPLWDLWPQIGLGLLAFTTMAWGILRMIYEEEPFFGLLINVFWISYYFVVYSTIFWFNRVSPVGQDSAEVVLLSSKS